jgi:carbonic anhydrase/acetyltransferase-like protein (isoleucine patch superfamily)
MTLKSEKIFIASGAVVIGDVTLNENVGIWYNATVRGDSDTIYVGRDTNIQDNCVVHTAQGYPVRIGEGVTIGHSAIVHGCTIGDNTMIGMGSIVMNGAVVGKNCIIGAGSLVTEHTEIPDNSVVFGSPAKIRRSITKEELASNIKNAAHYIEEAAKYMVTSDN